MNRALRLSPGAKKGVRRLRRPCVECDVADAIDAGHVEAGDRPGTLVVDLGPVTGVSALADVEHAEDGVYHIFLVRRGSQGGEHGNGDETSR
jgi:hypothetical protein